MKFGGFLNLTIIGVVILLKIKMLVDKDFHSCEL